MSSWKRDTITKMVGTIAFSIGIVYPYRGLRDATIADGEVAWYSVFFGTSVLRNRGFQPVVEGLLDIPRSLQELLVHM